MLGGAILVLQLFSRPLAPFGNVVVDVAGGVRSMRSVRQGIDISGKGSSGAAEERTHSVLRERRPLFSILLELSGKAADGI